MTDEKAYAEWRTWHAVCAELRAQGIEVDDAKHDRLVRTIRAYASRYHDLFEPGEYHPQVENDRKAVRFPELR